MPTKTICIDCARTVQPEQARRSRCPSCFASWKASRPKSQPSPQAQARKAQHQQVVGSSRWKRTRATVKARDGACLLCGSTSNLEVHHVTPARESADPFDVDDLVTLCQACHARVDALRRRRARGY